MFFDSLEYAVFLVVVLGLYYALARKVRAQNVLLLAASYFFYGFWNWRFLSLIIASTLLDFFCSRAIARSSDPRRRKALVALSAAGNLGILGFFKYYNFFAENLQALLGGIGLETNLLVLHIVLPVGISFYTFQTMSYTIDVYRRKLRPASNLLDFAVYVSFFPQLVAGPIERGANLLPQVQGRRRLTRERLYDGGWLIFWGLYKKVFIADNLARLVDSVYTDPSAASGPAILIATYAFAFQIYADFSGYTDMARGSAKLLGIDLTLNFNLPYFAKSPTDFWRRWHISLSEWLRDYLYIPLGGGRGTRAFVFRNLMITMALGGLWHGARWNFVAWGVFHGLLLVAYRLLGRGEPATRWGKAAAIFIMFQWTCLGWMFFRLETIGDFPVMASRLFAGWTFSGAQWAALGALVGYTALLIAMQFAQYFRGDLLAVKRLPGWLRAVLYVILYFSITLGGAFDGRAFIYFQF